MSYNSTEKTPAHELQRVYLEFLNDLVQLLPLHTDLFLEQIEIVKKDELYALRHIIPNLLPHMDEVSKRNSTACIALGEQFLLVPKLSFQTCWNSELTQSNQDTLWKYLHTFYYLTCSYEKLDDLLQEFAPPHSSFKGIIRNLQNHATISQQIITHNMFQMPTNTPNFPFGENSAIGQLAKEIAQDVDVNAFKDIQSPADLFRGMFGGAGGPSQGGASSVGKLISSVGQKLTEKLGSGKLNEANIFQEAQQMMGMMSPMMTQMMSSAFFPKAGGSGKNGPDLFQMMSGFMTPPSTPSTPATSEPSIPTESTTSRKKRNKHKKK